MATRSLLACGLAALAQTAAADFSSDFDCAARNLALEYAYNLQPERPSAFFQAISDALNGTPEKPSNCTVAVPAALMAATARNSRFRAPSQQFLQQRLKLGNTYYVDYANGADSNTGSVQSPLKTIAAAINLTRADRPATWTLYPGVNAVYGGPDTPGDSAPGYPFLGYTDSEADCQAACLAAGNCPVYTWHDTNNGIWSKCCYGRQDGIVPNYPQADHYTGKLNPVVNSESTIVLRGGTHYLSGTLTLGPADSSLTVMAFPGEEAWISGAVPVTNVTWQEYNVSTAAGTWTRYPGQNAVTGAVPGPGQGAPGIPFLGSTTTEAACLAACNATAGCRAYTWHDSTCGPYANNCYGRTDGQFPLVSQSGHFSGLLATAPNIWVAQIAPVLAAHGLANEILGMRANGLRLQRARYPNWNSELSFGPSFQAGWTAQTSPRVPDVQIDLPSPVRDTTITMFKTFTAGIGGTCNGRFDPPAGYWCSANVQGGGSQIFFVPTAMNVTQAQVPHTPYANPRGGVIMTWRPGHWASWMAEIGDWTYDASTGASNFSIARGLYQGSRGADTGDEVYLENIFEELDWPGEWFYNASTGLLYYFANYTQTPGQPPVPPAVDGSLTVAALKHLVNITGSQSNPVSDINFLGVGFRDTAYTYMDPHGLPSGGDWSLERSAVLFAQGTQGLTVRGCVFERVDGNAILLSAYTRNASITDNEFAWLGATAIAQWGNTYGGDDRLPAGYGQDGSAGDQPRGTYIAGNWAHEIGIYQKQSSFYTQFKSSENLITKNVVFNGPRAHINFNDGFRGGSVIQANLLFNSCRESADHGPFNSWDRDPYTFDLPGLAPPLVATTKMYDHIHSNLVFANYFSLSSVDNDDGSNYYNITSNVQLYGDGGLKNDFEGHDGHGDNNLFVFVKFGASNGYSGVIGTPGQSPYQLPGHLDTFLNNTVYMTQDNKGWGYANIICGGSSQTIIGGNTVYTPSGNVSECGMPLAQWQAQNAFNDPGTVTYPASQASSDAFIALARTLLSGPVPAMSSKSKLFQ